MNPNPYKLLAERLDALPSGFPPAPDEGELRLLEKLYSPAEAALAARLRLTLEAPAEIAARLGPEGLQGLDASALPGMLKGMARKGLIAVDRGEGGLKYGLMPFVVGVYEAQNGRVDAELARLFEAYYLQAFTQTLAVQPAYHRVIPVGESIPVDLGIRPYESANAIVRQAQAWGVLDCICRVQQALIGEACEHPVDVCMVLGAQPGMFDHSPVIHALTLDGALATLTRAAQAGLVHSVSNVQGPISYICNCCTCACGILRGVAELGVTSVVARSAFQSQVDEARCSGCESCASACQFGALALGDLFMQVDVLRCVGCGVCLASCPEEALSLVRRSPQDILPVPEGEMAWRRERSQARGLDLEQVL
jgi:Na+-translocating ferredoxin:NAD+ oxidoreductase subunit B